MADRDHRHIGDGVERARSALERDAEIAGALAPLGARGAGNDGKRHEPTENERRSYGGRGGRGGRGAVHSGVGNGCARIRGARYPGKPPAP